MSLPDRARIHDKRIRCEFTTERGRRCHHRAESVDHITPQSIGEIFGLTQREINRRENLQYLCNRHHHAKDEDTARRADVLRAQSRGEFVGLGEHEQAMQKVALVQQVDQSLRFRSKQEAKRRKKIERERGQTTRWVS